jgi:hypothetical protein
MRGIVSTVDFQMGGIHTHLAGFLLDKRKRLPAISSAAVGGVKIQFVDERVVALEFKAEPAVSMMYPAVF